MAANLAGRAATAARFVTPVRPLCLSPIASSVSTRAAAREALCLPRARYDLTTALSAAIWPGLEVRGVVFRSHLLLLTPAAAGLAAMEAHFTAGRIWRQPTVR